jgi:hypothetical protein
MRDPGSFVARGVEPRYPIRMLALDIDGTLVGDDLVVGERTRRVILRAVHQGLAVSLVTGRMTGSAVRFAALLGLRHPIVGYQGGLVREMPRAEGRAGRLLFHRPLDAGLARAAVRWSHEHGLEAHLNHLESLVIPDEDPYVDDYSAFLGVRAIRVPSIEEWIQRPVTKVVAVGEPPRPTELLPAARAWLAGRAEATVAHPRFLEFTARGISKGAAVRWLARRQGIPPGAVLAIGDQLNDLEMISAVGHGTAMAGAAPDVLAAARYVAPPVEEEGAAEVIERLALAPEVRARAAAAELEAAASEARAAVAARLATKTRNAAVTARPTAG